MANDWPSAHMTEAAMGIICNVSQGDWSNQSPEWQDAANKWLEAYHVEIKNTMQADPAPA